MDKNITDLIKSARKAYDILHSDEKTPDYIKSNVEYALRESLMPFSFIEIEEED